MVLIKKSFIFKIHQTIPHLAAVVLSGLRRRTLYQIDRAN